MIKLRVGPIYYIIVKIIVSNKPIYPYILIIALYISSY